MLILIDLQCLLQNLEIKGGKSNCRVFYYYDLIRIYCERSVVLFVCFVKPGFHKIVSDVRIVSVTECVPDVCKIGIRQST